MARVTNNMLTHGAQGGVGKQFVYKGINGKNFIGKYPDMSQVVYNDAQKEYQNLFGRAAAYASAVTSDPVRTAAYEKLIRADKRKRGTSVYHAALKAFMTKHSHKKAAGLLQRILQQYLGTYPLGTPHAKAIEYLISQGKLSNAIYQQLNRVSKATATRHLQDLVKQGIIRIQGKGAGAIYALVNEIHDTASGNNMEEKELI